MNFKKISYIHNQNFNQKKDEKFFSNIQNVYKIFEVEDRGYLILIDSIDVYEIFEIAIDRNYHRMGYATKLLEQLPKDKDIFLEVREDNLSAIELYKKNGFKKIAIRKNYYGNKAAIIMKKYIDKNI